MKILIFFFLLFLNFSFAQTFIIKGKIVDYLDNPVELKTIYLLNKTNNDIVKTTAADEDGVFKFENIESENYTIKFVNSKFNEFTKNITVFNENLDLGKIIFLKDKIKTIDEVIIKAEKPIIQVFADKTVFSVKNSLTAQGSNAWELLRKAPGIIIDNNGGIILQGKTGVQISIDGKITVLSGTELQTFLEAMQSSTIDKLEIMTQPSSKYDAAGGAGIINIVFKKNKNLGLNGTVSNSLTIGDYLRNSNTFSINYRNKKNNIYSTISNGFGQNTGFLNLKREQNAKQFDAKTKNVYDRKKTNIRLGYDFFSTSKSTFGLILNSNINDTDSQNNSRTPIQGLGNSDIDSVLIARSQSNSSNRNYLVNLNYKFTDSLENSFNIDLDYGDFRKIASAYQPNIYYNSAENTILSQSLTSQETSTNISILSFQSDYEKRLFGGKISTGIKISKVDTDNSFNFFNFEGSRFALDQDQSNKFKYQEDINAAYFNYKKETVKWSFQFGVRLENTKSKGTLIQTENANNQIVARDYIDWFPSGGITYYVSSKNQLSLIYSKRIERPNYSTLNPFEFKIDELSYSKGNPFLKPEYTNTIKFSNTYNSKLSTSVSYSYISDSFAQVTEAIGTDRNYLIPQNIANKQVVSIEISLPQKINSWWTTYLNLNAYESFYKSSNANYNKVNQKTLSLYAQNTFSLPHKIILEVSGWFSSPSIWGGTYITKSSGSLNLAVQKKFFNNKLNAEIGLNDILFTSPWRGTTRYGNLKIDGSGGSDSRNLIFNFIYNFGNNEVKKSRTRNQSFQEQKDRVN